MSGFSRRTVELIVTRDGGMCVSCRVRPYTNLHHRTPRGMGGSKDPVINSPANGVSLCGSGTTGCHGWIETHRTEAYLSGLLVKRGTDPATVPLRWRGRRVLLTHDGRVMSVPVTAEHR